ncbi:hypothetical protein D1BOALGB6SA_1605 [Olavius sp. associated proteobacterium Delta 1]|nr:hypothetical protein D1BOALGB6SA_1605 [Olavius sp. associated proteobacterium Delta 1]
MKIEYLMSASDGSILKDFHNFAGTHSVKAEHECSIFNTYLPLGGFINQMSSVGESV